MSDTATTAEAEAEAGEKKGGMTRILVIVLAVIIVAMAVYMFVLAPSGGDGEAEPEPEPTMTEPVEGEVLPVSVMTINLNDDDLRFARVGFALVLDASVGDSAALEEKFPLLQDAAITEVSKFTADRLLTEEGQQELRDVLTQHAQEVYPNGEVIRVVLTDLIVQ